MYRCNVCGREFQTKCGYIKRLNVIHVEKSMRENTGYTNTKRHRCVRQRRDLLVLLAVVLFPHRES